MREYVSIKTGEIVTGIPAVIKTIFEDFLNYHIVNVLWKRYILQECKNVSWNRIVDMFTES